MRYPYPKNLRVKKSWEFKKILKNKKISGNFILVSYRKTGKNFPRLGIVISKKLGKAFLRNRFKRQLKEVFRTNIKNLPAIDMVISPKSLKRPPSYKNLLKDLINLSSKIRT